MYRIRKGTVEVLLAHPGGPRYRDRDKHVWSIPKGEPDNGEGLLETAQREFEEETGYTPDGDYVPLQPIQQKGGKIVHAWAFEGDCDTSAIESNCFTTEWPPGSGKHKEFPEVDRAEFFDLKTARKKIKAGQEGLLSELKTILGNGH